MLSTFKNLAYQHRWIKRLVTNYLPEIDSIYLKNSKLRLAFSARDLTGPSFHLSHGQDVGFQNYEEADKNFVVNYLKENPGLFVDIGANIGLFSFYILHKLSNQNIFAFEPEPQAFNCLELSKSYNNFKTFVPFNYAIGEKKENLHFFIDAKNFGGHRLHRLSPDEKSIEVSVSPLREFLSDQKVSAVKIDVEGAELAVLKGMKDTINFYKPLLVVECLNEDLGNRGPLYELLSQFESIRCLSLDVNHYVSIDEIAEFALGQLKKGHLHNNYFFVFN